MMNHSKIAKKHQQMPVNILADIGTLAKTMPDILDLSIGDPDLITDESIINAAFETFVLVIQNIPNPVATWNSLMLFVVILAVITIFLLNVAKSVQQSARFMVCI